MKSLPYKSIPHSRFGIVSFYCLSKQISYIGFLFTNKRSLLGASVIIPAICLHICGPIVGPLADLKTILFIKYIVWLSFSPEGVDNIESKCVFI